MYDAGAIVFNIRAAGATVFRQELSEADKAAEKLGRTTETASSKTEQLGKQQETTAEKTRRLAKDQADAASRAKDYAEAQDHVGKVLVTAGAAIVGTTALTVKAALDWQSAWTGVTKTVEGTPDELAAVEEGLRGLTGVLPASHDEIAAVAEAAGQLGVKTKDVVGFTRTMIDLGETTNLSSDQAATSLAQLMNIMGTAGGDVDRLGATIVALGNDGASTEAEIVQMAQRIAGSGKLVGATEGEVLALANALASMGVTAELGGGVASRILQDLYSAVESGGAKLDGFAKVAGVSASEFAAAFRADPVRAMGEFATGLNGVEKSGGNVVQTLTDLGFKSTEEQRILLQLKSGGDLLTESLELQNTAWQENSALATEAAKRYDTVESQLAIMGNRVNDAAIDLGSVFLPVLAEGANAVGDFADGVASLPAPMQEAIAVGSLMIGMVALFGGTALIAVPKVIALWTQVRLLATSGTGLTAGLGKAATFLTGPWGLALLAATTAVVVLQSHVDSLKATTEEYQNVIQNAKSAEDLFKIADQGTIISDLQNSTKSAKDFQEALNTIQTNDFARGMSISISQLSTRLKDMGTEFATLSKTDLPSAQRAFRLLADDMELSKDQQIQLLDSMPDYKAALVELANQKQIDVTSSNEAANATKLLELAQGDGATQAETVAEAYVSEADSVKALTDELIALIDAINIANGMNQDAISANADYQAALAGISEEVVRQKEAYEAANGTLTGFNLSLDENTAAGSANAASLAGVAQSAQEAAAKQFELDQQTMSGKDAADKYAATLTAQKQAFIDSATGAGYNAEQVRILADRVFQLPTEKEVKVIADTADAQNKVLNLINSFNQLPTFKNITIKATADGTGTVLKDWKDGGVVSYHANGSVSENHVAQIARAGDYRVWAEAETGGEGYIPLAESKRARSEMIMAEIANRFGGAYIPGGARRYADGSPASTGPVGGNTYYDVKVIIPAEDPRIAVRMLADELRTGLASS